MTFFLTIAKLDQNRENNFDFIRFVAAAMVIFSHTYAVLKDNSSEPLSGATGFITFGSLAVEIFFIVSGYLVCKSLLMRSSPLAFVEARILRIFPALIICCASCTLVLGPILTRLPLGEYFGAAQTWHYLFDNATLLKLQWFLPGVFEHNPLPGVVNGSLWTLPTEFKMYLALLAAGLIVLPFPSQRERVLLVMVAGCFVFAHITYPGRLISHVSNVVEHPELICQRIVRLAKLVGRENVIAGSDCGFAQQPTHQRVHPTIQWAKLEALAEGARLATKELWGRGKKAAKKPVAKKVAPKTGAAKTVKRKRAA